MCARPTFSIGPMFFHIAASVVNVGVLLLVNDGRFPKQRVRLVHDFGTGDYDRSMVIQGLYCRKCNS